MVSNYLVLDIATAPIPDAALYLEGSVKPPANYRDADKIAEYVREKEAERLAMAATDIDLAQVTAFGYQTHLDDKPIVYRPIDVVGGETAFMVTLGEILISLRPTIITYGGFNFDLPVLMRRARYLGVDFPALNLDRYRSPHLDLCEILSDRNPQRRRPLSFYVKRLGWTDLSKPLSGAEEAQVPVSGRWDDLAASLRHDVTATYRLAVWLGVIAPAAVEQPEPVF